jgi:hypothetical protein
VHVNGDAAADERIAAVRAADPRFVAQADPIDLHAHGVH